MAKTKDPPDELLTREEAAMFLRVSPSTLETWVTRKKGPKFVKVGSLVRYRLTDLEDYLCDRTQNGEE